MLLQKIYLLNGKILSLENKLKIMILKYLNRMFKHKESKKWAKGHF